MTKPFRFAVPLALVSLVVWQTPLPVTLAWNLDQSHASATFEVEVDGTVMPCTNIITTTTERRCTASATLGKHTFRLRGTSSGGVGPWSTPVDDVLLLPGSWTVTATIEAPPNPVQPIRVNFQTSSVTTPAGYIADTGSVFANRGNGQSYGWLTDNTAQARVRNDPRSPDVRYDTLNQFQRPANPNATWELAVLNGSYSVRIVAGDPTFTDSTHHITAEGTLVLSGTPSSTALFIDATATVAVSDGRLTIQAAADGNNTKICFVEITPQ